MTKNPSEVQQGIQSILITPELAKDWLANNTRNRPSDIRRVRALADTMLAGRFMHTHQGIAFDTNNVLLDGQHRLKAIVLSGVACRMSVTWGVDPNAVEVIDIGKARSAGQTLAIQGVKQANYIAAISRAALYGLGSVNGSRYTDVLVFARAHVDTVALYIPVAQKLSASAAGAFLRADMTGLKKVRHAAHRLVTLEFEPGDDPMRALANRLRDRLRVKAQYACCVTALRAVDEGRQLKIVREAVLDLPELP